MGACPIMPFHVAPAQRPDRHGGVSYPLFHPFGFELHQDRLDRQQAGGVVVLAADGPLIMHLKDPFSTVRSAAATLIDRPRSLAAAKRVRRWVYSIG